MEDHYSEGMVADGTRHQQAVAREHQELEGIVNCSFMMEHTDCMQRDTPAAVTDSNECECGRVSDSVDMDVMKMSDNVRHTSTIQPRDDIANERQSTDVCRAAHDGLDGSQSHHLSLDSCHVDDDCPRTEAAADTDTTNHTCDSLNTEQTALPPYSVPQINSVPRTRHQTRASSSLRRYRKLCTECCLRCIIKATSLRFLMLVIVLIGSGCVAAGIALGALNMSSDNNYFSLSVVFIGEFKC